MSVASVGKPTADMPTLNPTQAVLFQVAFKVSLCIFEFLGN